MTASSACTKLMSTSRHVGSAVAQLVTAASANDDQQHIGASAVELAQVRPGLTGFFLPKIKQIFRSLTTNKGQTSYYIINEEVFKPNGFEIISASEPVPLLKSTKPKTCDQVGPNMPCGRNLSSDLLFMARYRIEIRSAILSSKINSSRTDS